MGSVPMSDLVTIIVKAPNQQISDQIIQCHHSWTIKKLKDYLSEVYPSKPKLEEQKLIYSGKLLTDSAVLKDVLRTYEGQENHTVHLVCTTKAQKFAKTPSSYSSAPTVDRPQTSTSDAHRHQDSSQSRSTPTMNTNPGSVPVTGIRAPTLEQISANQFHMNNFDPRYFWPSATTFPNMNEADPSQQYVYMQQAYAQYISQYMQMMGQPGLSYMPSHMPQFVGTSQTTPLPNNDRPNGERNVARENPPGQPVVGAAGNDDDEENRNNRDWLDWFYVFSRVVVLFSVVYFYSTPLRLLAVSLLLCMFYLHQNMRVQNDVHGNNNNNNQAVNQNNNQNNENRAAAENPAANENPPAAAPQPGPLLNAGGAAGANAAPESTVPQTEPSVPRIPERPSPVAITLLAIRTFFLSLVPEHHTL